MEEASPDSVRLDFENKYWTILYIDIEGQSLEKLAEICALAICRPTIRTKDFYVQEYWALSRLELMAVGNEYDYNFIARHCHCISADTVMCFGTNDNIIKFDFTKFFNADLRRPMLVRTHGVDVSKTRLLNFFPHLNMENVEFKEIQMPSWVQRQDELYHKIAKAM